MSLIRRLFLVGAVSGAWQKQRADAQHDDHSNDHPADASVQEQQRIADFRDVEDRLPEVIVRRDGRGILDSVGVALRDDALLRDPDSAVRDVRGVSGAERDDIPLCDLLERDIVVDHADAPDRDRRRHGTGHDHIKPDAQQGQDDQRNGKYNDDPAQPFQQRFQDADGCGECFGQCDQLLSGSIIAQYAGDCKQHRPQNTEINFQVLLEKQARFFPPTLGPLLCISDQLRS